MADELNWDLPPDWQETNYAEEAAAYEASLPPDYTAEARSYELATDINSLTYNTIGNLPEISYAPFVDNQSGDLAYYRAIGSDRYLGPDFSRIAAPGDQFRFEQKGPTITLYGPQAYGTSAEEVRSLQDSTSMFAAPPMAQTTPVSLPATPVSDGTVVLASGAESGTAMGDYVKEKKGGPVESKPVFSLAANLAKLKDTVTLADKSTDTAKFQANLGQAFKIAIDSNYTGTKDQFNKDVVKLLSQEEATQAQSFLNDLSSGANLDQYKDDLASKTKNWDTNIADEFRKKADVAYKEGLSKEAFAALGGTQSDLLKKVSETPLNEIPTKIAQARQLAFDSRYAPIARQLNGYANNLETQLTVPNAKESSRVLAQIAGFYGTADSGPAEFREQWGRDRTIELAKHEALVSKMTPNQLKDYLALAIQQGSAFTSRKQSEANLTIKQWDGSIVHAVTKEQVSFDPSNLLAMTAAGIGLYQALVQTPKSAKDARDWEEKMVRRRMKYEQQQWERNVSLSSGGGGGGGGGSRSPVAVSPVRF